MKAASHHGVVTGVHYAPLHQMELYSLIVLERALARTPNLTASEEEGRTTLSLPFHEGMTDTDVKKVISVIEDAR